MPKLRLNITWAASVAIDMLGAHMEAYVTSQATISTLRLCNRFGTGENVAVNKLPIELIEHIEEQYMADQRSAESKQELTCWKAGCFPSEHVDLDDEAQMKPISDEWSHNADFWSDETLERNREEVNYHLTDCRDDTEYGPPPPWGVLDSWRTIHEERKSRWENKTDSPNHRGTSQLETYNSTIKKHFGLEV